MCECNLLAHKSCLFSFNSTAPNVDFQSVVGQFLTISSTSTSFTYTVIGDAIDEGPETFNLELFEDVPAGGDPVAILTGDVDPVAIPTGDGDPVAIPTGDGDPVAIPTGGGPVTIPPETNIAIITITEGE
jgi:hypothetical protein